MRLFRFCRTLWHRYGFPALMITIVVFFLLYWWLETRFETHGTYSKTYYYHPDLSNYLRSSPPPIHPPQTRPSSPTSSSSKGERVCKAYLEKRFRRPFTKCRPIFLHNPVTGENLELDLYNEDLRLAVEYNGRQHYEYVPFFHQTREKFQTQKYRDLMKKEMCARHGIALVIVPYTVPEDEIPGFLEKELAKHAPSV